MDMIQLYEEKEKDIFKYLMSYGDDEDEDEVSYKDMISNILELFFDGYMILWDRPDSDQGSEAFIFEINDRYYLSWVEYGSCTVCDELQYAFTCKSKQAKAVILLNIILTFCQNTDAITNISTSWELKTEIEKLTKENEELKKENKRVTNMKESVYKQFYDAVKAVTYRFEEHVDDIR